jgi:molybdopterin-containing oxidoreductase family iron-sulfur binding subunit
VIYVDPVEAEPTSQAASIRDLADAIKAGQVEALVILGGNPVLTAPSDLQFGEGLKKVSLSVHVSLYEDETSELCQWHVPEAHFLESWGDVRAYDGTISLIQPLIAPLYDGKTASEVLATLSERPDRTSHDLLKELWQERSGAGNFERFWQQTLHDGIMAETAAVAKNPPLRDEWIAAVAKLAAVPSGLEVLFRPDASAFDGRFANSGWLQELPKTITRLTWENAVLVSPQFAEERGLRNGDVVDLSLSGRSVQGPVWLVPGQAPQTLTLTLGYGRRRAGSVGNGLGFDVYPLRLSDGLWMASGVDLRKTGEHLDLATTQDHHSMEGRGLVRVEKVGEKGHGHGGGHGAGHGDLSLHPSWSYEGAAWGMVIDLNRCVGCNACVVACQSENNIPVVGKSQVANGREMHWIRIDRYFEGDLDTPAIYHQPVPCMHCERAPCEPVCPVNATVHSHEGLNDMVYNRCVGTRYCANNCPYKVRRFNFFLYTEWEVEPLKMLANPDVTIRSRGVMEKCTYCVQRINYARIKARREDRSVRDGEIVTACQAVCPAEAISFGDINDPKSQVAKWKHDARHYGILEELGVRPRTTYLSVVKNPNPALQV